MAGGQYTSRVLKKLPGVHMRLYEIPNTSVPNTSSADGQMGHVVGADRFHHRFMSKLDTRLRQVEIAAHALIYDDAPHLHLADLQEQAQHIAQTAPVGGWLSLGLHARELDRVAEDIWTRPVTQSSALQVLPQLEKVLTEGALVLRQG